MAWKFINLNKAATEVPVHQVKAGERVLHEIRRVGAHARPDASPESRNLLQGVAHHLGGCSPGPREPVNTSI